MHRLLNDTHARMDAMYRYQRYIYDATRKYYLLGRDRLLDRLPIGAGDTVLEIGCGTGRNLRKLARSYPDTRFFGLDASAEMLAIAEKKIRSDGLTNMKLRPGLAESFHHAATFSCPQRFDVIFFSYALSMIPSWREAIDVAVSNLATGGILGIVDFYDQADLPRWFEAGLSRWLSKFGVKPWPDLVPSLEALASEGSMSLSLETIAGRYAFIATLERQRGNLIKDSRCGNAWFNSTI